MFAIIFICRSLYFCGSLEKSQISQKLEPAKVLCHMVIKSVHQLTTSQLIGHTANSQSAILSVNESVSQQVSLSVCQSISPEVISRLVSNSTGQSAIKGPLNQTVNQSIYQSVEMVSCKQQTELQHILMIKSKTSHCIPTLWQQLAQSRSHELTFVRKSSHFKIWSLTAHVII